MLRKLAKDSVIYGGGDAVTKIVAFITFPLLAVTLSPYVYGVLELVMTLVGVFGLLVGCGLNNAAQRYYWDVDTKAEERPAIVSSGLLVQIFIGVLILIFSILFLYVFWSEIQGLHLPLTWVALVAAATLMILNQWLQYILDVLRLHFSPWRFVIISLLSRVVASVAGVIVVVYLGRGLDELLSIEALVLFLVTPFALLSIRKDLTVKIEKKWVAELVSFGYPFIFVGLAYWLFGSMDRWMLAEYATTEEVGIYSISFRFASVVLFISTAFGQAWSPISIKLKADYPEQYREIYAGVLLLVLFVMLFVGGGLALFSGELIGMIMSESYVGSALPMAILCFGVILQATQQVTAIGISLEKKTFLFARLAWVTALINFILNWALIPKFGAVGAAWATTISYMALTGSYLYYTQRLHPLPIRWGDFSSILFLGVCVCVCAVSFNSTDFVWWIVGVKLFFAFCCTLLGWMALRPIRSFGLGI